MGLLTLDDGPELRFGVPRPQGAQADILPLALPVKGQMLAWFYLIAAAFQQSQQLGKILGFFSNALSMAAWNKSR